ncbi:hypothetical protein BJL95_02405 [Methylomonas sp. LWB]|uniref:RHS protein conserved region domain-containing protein n=1 Tax=Methylomonas koyamae TaxID=702114 RepID=A0A177NHZ0_9GAMM|nr:hypothetical protein A1355_08975 [Methylomonas koyamae]OHX37395.1 hypothetical protein BJL95_02405 [Methylomonas sp. LWB]
MTDSTGKIVWSARYRAYGNLALADVEAIDNPLRFQGQYYDAETGLHYNLNRYYDPNAGRFIHQDPIGLEGGTNVYRYAPNPLNWVDPLGLVNLNTNSATGNFGVYEIQIDDVLYKYGKADLSRVTQSSGLPTRLHQQVVKLGKQNPDSEVVGRVIDKGMSTTKEAKAVETKKLQEYFDQTGNIPEGNKKSFKPTKTKDC